MEQVKEGRGKFRRNEEVSKRLGELNKSKLFLLG
jgi:hypothetical protein